MVDKWSRMYAYRSIADWALDGSPVPPPQTVKVLWLDRMRQAAGSTAFVETGTLAGTTSAMMSFCDGLAVHTIEIDERQFVRAKEKLAERPNVTQHLGNSAVILPELVPTLPDRTLFWLDAHCSGDHTGQAETKSVLTQEVALLTTDLTREFVLVLDDARSFNGRAGYPHLDDLLASLRGLSDTYDARTGHDAVTYAPKSVWAAFDAAQYSVNSAPFLA
ncbi:hypothetical protein [Acuticoccus sp. I52.16.1]|uniref:hypothetical protein n=1 Tax=Acuticoccus sp. I52.16.1 TaxID=2928472 RepID=UPI001FD4183B|nr:hypothetical protein [Acuticoccus sp. I52.16.1]UOM35986.1 hypothetical protein MRB58_07250 [Acuticoccus sp. I52.16.1]